MLLALVSVCLLCVSCAHTHDHKHVHHSDGGQQQHHDSEVDYCSTPLFYKRGPSAVPVIADVPGYIENPEGPQTRSVSGQFRGSWMETRRGRRFQAYRGIRYAEPPIGALRFQPPKLKLEYEGEVDATEEGPACPLPAPPTYYVDEDCLTVNVYTPINNSTGPLPVIFFIHAGGFYAFTGRSDLAGPHYLLDRDVVLVTINYRLGSLGLFHRGIAMSSSPIGKQVTPLTHQRHLAVRQAEILNCPTDNSSIIVDCLMTKPWKELGDSLPKFWEFGEGDPIGLWGPVLEPDFGQERYLDINPLDAVKQGKMHTVPLIISQTTDEFFWKAFPVLQNETLLKQMNEEWERVAPISFILPQENRAVAVKRLREFYLEGKKLVNDKKSEKALGRLYGDSVIGFNVHRMANLMCRHSKHPVWYYEFAYVGNNSHYEDANGKPQGAAHHDDQLYVFTLSYRYPTIPVDSPHSHVVDEMTAIWYNFARYGDPNPRKDTPELGNLSWPAMKPDARSYLHRGDKLSIRQNMFEERFQVWDQLYPIEY